MDLTKKARTYSFEDKEFSPEEINLIANQKGLVGISFKNCPITDDDIEKLSGLDKLVNVNIENSKITDKSLEYLAKLPKLTYLFITKANISGAGLIHFKEHKKLAAIWLVETNLNDEQIIHLKDFKKLGTVRICDTQVTRNGLFSIAQNQKLKIVCNNGKVTKKDIEDFEAEQRKLNKKKLEFNQKDIDDATEVLKIFFKEINAWEEYAENNGHFTDDTFKKCKAIFDAYCLEEFTGRQSISSSPNHTYTNQKIIDFEQQTKNKVILYTKDTYLDNQYRYILLRKENKWKIDKRQWLDSGWKKDYL